MFLRNEFESVVVRWINLEPVIQGEVSQRENKYHILMHEFYWLCRVHWIEQISHINACIRNLEK